MSSCIGCKYNNGYCPNPNQRKMSTGCSHHVNNLSFEILIDEKSFAKLVKNHFQKKKKQEESFLEKQFNTIPQNLVDQNFCEPEKIIVNIPATIVFWKDGTKTVVKCAAGTDPDLYSAFCAAVCKKIFGSNSHLKKVIEEAYAREKK